MADYQDDYITSQIVKQIVARHDDDMDEQRAYMGLAKAAYGARFWEWVHEQGDQSDRRYRMFEDRYEINLIRKGINAYHAALFQKRMSAIVGRTADTTGDAESAKLLLNSWMFSDVMRSRIDTAIRQCLLYNGCGLKVSYEPRSGQAHKSLSPHERVYARVFPWYELVKDSYAKDVADARFYGHITYKPRRQVAELYDIPYEDLRGSRETSYLEDGYDSQHRNYAGKDETELEGDYVRVLELCNLVDHHNNNDYPGRFEVHLIDQGELSEEPVFVGEMPLWNADGRPVSHILPMIFEHEAEYPLQGIAPCKSWLHQQAELNAYRSQMASESRKNKTVFLYDKNLGSDIIQRIANAKSMDGIAVDPDNVLNGDLRRAVVPIEQPPISVNIREHAAKAEQDLISSFSLSPSAIGITQQVTAQEIRYQRDFSDSEFGRYASARDRTLAQLAMLALRAFVAAMLDDGDMESDHNGEDDAADLEMADLADDADAALFDADSGADLAVVDEDIDKRLFDAKLSDLDFSEPEEEEAEETMSDVVADALKEGVRVDDDTADLYEERGIETTGEETIKLLDAKGDLVVIRVEDIDSEFDIGFTETGRTPASDAQIRANLAQILPQYMQLFDIIMQGGPQGVVATEAARAYYSEYSLPENLDPTRLIAQMETEKGEPQAGMPTGAPPQAGQAPQQAAPAEQAAQPAGDGDVLQQLIDAHGEDPQFQQAMQAIITALQSAPPEIAAQIQEQIMQIAAMPPEQQIEGLMIVAQAVSQGDAAQPSQDAAAPAPAAPQAEPPAPAAAPSPQDAAPPTSDIEEVKARLQDASPDIEDALDLAERVLPNLKGQLNEQGVGLLQQFTELLNQALSTLNAIDDPATALDMVEEAGQLLEQAEDAAETLSSMAPAEVQADLDALIEAVSDAADALIDSSPGEGGLTEEDMDDDDDEEQTDG